MSSLVLSELSLTVPDDLALALSRFRHVATDPQERGSGQVRRSGELVGQRPGGRPSKIRPVRVWAKGRDDGLMRREKWKRGTFLQARARGLRRRGQHSLMLCSVIGSWCDGGGSDDSKEEESSAGLCGGFPFASSLHMLAPALL